MGRPKTCYRGTGEFRFSDRTHERYELSCGGPIQAVYAREYGRQGSASKWVTLGWMCLRCWQFEPTRAPR